MFPFIDAGKGTIDPAFDAHILPIKHYAYAWWEHWQAHKLWDRSFSAAVKKIGAAKRSAWDIVSGPVLTMLASAQRIGWEFNSGCVVSDDLGRTFDFRVDSHASIMAAVRDSVRR